MQLKRKLAPGDINIGYSQDGMQKITWASKANLIHSGKEFAGEMT
jgi:hypothetical protein